MKLIQLGGANDALCHFLSVGGFSLLLDCGVSLVAGTTPLRVQLPALAAVDVASLDVVVLSNHASLLALPFLTNTLGFQGTVYATAMTLGFGRVLLEELHAQTPPVVFELAPTVASASTGPSRLPPFSLEDVAACLDRVTVVEFKEPIKLAYGVTLTALSAGFSLGASMWLIEAPSERIAYVATASGDLNRHPKELDFAPLIDCDTLIVTDIKPDRDPHATTEHTVERLLAAVNRVVDRGGVCVLPCVLAGVLLDLIDAVYAACLHNKTPSVPIVLLSPAADDVLDLSQCGAEFLCEKKVETLYAGEAAFAHERLRTANVLHVASALTPSVVASLQHGGVVFTSHPTLRLGVAADVVRAFGGYARNAVVLTDPTFDPHDVLSPFYALPIEKMVCPIDARLSCGDVNQFIARCCPRSLIVPHEFLVATSTTVSSGGVKSEPDAHEASHFARVFPLHELIAARPKTELETIAMKRLEPIVLEKPNKYIDGKLDPALAARAVMTEINGKGVACITGRIAVRNHEFIVEALSGVSLSSSMALSSTNKSDPKARVTGAKRKAPSPTSAPTLSPTGAAISTIEYKERSSMLLGQVDEERLEQQLKAHDPHLDVYISQGPANADAMVSIPALDAHVTLWKEDAKTLIETSKADARTLLQGMRHGLCEAEAPRHVKRLILFTLLGFETIELALDDEHRAMESLKLTSELEHAVRARESLRLIVHRPVFNVALIDFCSIVGFRLRHSRSGSPV